MDEVAKVCPKCTCPVFEDSSIRTAEVYSAWKDTDGTWYNGPAEERTTHQCLNCGWLQRILRRRGKLVSVESFVSPQKLSAVEWWS